MPLAFVDSGRQVMVMAVDGEEKIKNRLLGFGIFPGTSLRILQKNSSSLVLKVRETRLMLPFGTACNIQVQ